MDAATIDVGAVWARLRGPSAQTARVREAFTLDSPGAEYLRWGDGKTRFLKQGDTFLSGLTWRVISVLMQAGFPKPTVRWPLVMERPPLVTDPVEVREAYQEPAIQKMIRARRMGVQIPTGGGKTITAIEAARRLGQRTLWLTHRKELMEQTAKEFERLLGVECGRLGAGKEIDGDGRVTVAMVQTLARMLNKKRGAPEIVKPWLAEFGCVIGDEGHNAAADSWQEIYMQCVNAQYRYVLSGTLDKITEAVNAWKIEGATGPTWVVTGVSQLADLGFLAKPIIRVLRVPAETYPTYEDVREFICPEWRDNPMALKYLGGPLFRETYERGIIDNAARNTKGVETIGRHVQAGEKMLVLCSRVSHMLALTDTIRGLGLSVIGLDGESTDAARTEALMLFRTGLRGRALVATPFMREGIDLPQVDVGMLAGGGLSDIAVMQGLGRMLRPRQDKNSVLIYDFEDGGNPATEREDKDYLANHWRSRLALYTEQGFTIERAFLL